MSTTEIAVLGLVAGITIFLGLPVGRIRNLSGGTRALLTAGSAGVLAFLFVETVSEGFAPVEDRIHELAHRTTGSWAEFALHAAVFAAAFGAGLVGLVYYDRRIARRRPVHLGPGTATAAEFRVVGRIHALSEPRRLALFIAIGIGLHNFAEGLAIGQSAGSGRISLAVLLVVGFAAHNATEGFGIVAPLTAETEPPSWSFLAWMGVIGGGPTFVGTLIGQAYVDTLVNSAFLALAAGSILYVIVQLLVVAFKIGHKEMLMWGLFGGMMLGLGTELVLVAANV